MKKLILSSLSIFTILSFATSVNAQTLDNEMDNIEVSYVSPTPSRYIERYYPSNMGRTVYASTPRNGHIYSGTLYYIGYVNGLYKYGGTVYLTPNYYPLSVSPVVVSE